MNIIIYLFLVNDTVPVKHDQFYLLGHLKNSKKTQCSQSREAKGPCTGLEVDPKHFKNGSKDDDTVKLVESRVKVVWAERIHSDHHFKYKGT